MRILHADRLAGLVAIAAAALAVSFGALAVMASTGTSAGAAQAHHAKPKHSKPRSASLTVTWCRVKIGESKAAVIKTMGPVHGDRGADEMRGMNMPADSYSEWDVGNDILLASYRSGAVVDLQAYDGRVGPLGAKNLPCAAFRNASGTS